MFKRNAVAVGDALRKEFGQVEVSVLALTRGQIFFGPAPFCTIVERLTIRIIRAGRTDLPPPLEKNDNCEPLLRKLDLPTDFFNFLMLL